VLGAERALGRLAAAATNLGVELGAVPLADGRATDGADLRIELATIFLLGGVATTLGGFRPRLGAGLAARGRSIRLLGGLRFGACRGHLRIPFSERGDAHKIVASPDLYRLKEARTCGAEPSSPRNVEQKKGRETITPSLYSTRLLKMVVA